MYSSLAGLALPLIYVFYSNIACFPFSGVIWKGDSLIEGVPETLDMLRTKVHLNTFLHFAFSTLKSIFHPCFSFFQGKRLVFVTNNSTKSRKQYGKKFETLGLSVNEVDFVLLPHYFTTLVFLLHAT